MNSANDQAFWYTAAWRLQNANGPWGEFVYAYDDNGNRTFEVLTQGSTTTEWTSWYSSTSNRLAGVAENSVVNRTFSHDDAGNITYDDRNGTMYAYAYNARSRLSNLTVGGAQRGAYTYDAFERLSIRTVTSGGIPTTIHTVQDRGGRIIVEATDAGATTREYIWLDDMPIAVVADVDTATPKLWFVHTDHLDRPIMMTDGAKAPVWEAVWKPWGAPHSITGTASLDMRFPGQWFQAESGLHYNWHRQYDPTTGRYTQADPLGFVDSANPYAYALSSPTQFDDPDAERTRIAEVLRKIGNELKKFRFEGPNEKYWRSGQGRICQIRYSDWYIGLDFQETVQGSKDPYYHLQLGSSQKGKWNSPHLPLNPRRWFD